MTLLDLSVPCNELHDQVARFRAVRATLHREFHRSSMLLRLPELFRLPKPHIECLLLLRLYDEHHQRGIFLFRPLGCLSDLECSSATPRFCF